MKIRKAFNAQSQKVEDHTVTIDLNGEYLFVAPDKSFFKLPGHLDKDGIDQALEAHEKANKGQMSQVQVEKENEEKLKNV